MPSVDDAHLQLPVEYLALLHALLQQHVPHAQVWAYGSRVRGGAQECSDVDVVLRNPDGALVSCKGCAALKAALQESALPIVVDVHDWAQLPIAFRQNIAQEYVELQAGYTVPVSSVIGKDCG